MPRLECSEGRRRMKKLEDRLYRFKKEVSKESFIQQAVSDIE